MDQPTYSELLKDPRWQKKRLEIMRRDSFTCQVCGDTKTALNVHHKQYFNGKKPWEYKDEDLITLCECCHTFAEKNKNIFGFNVCEDIRGSVLKSKSPDIKVRLYNFLNLSLIYLFDKSNKPIKAFNIVRHD